MNNNLQKGGGLFFKSYCDRFKGNNGSAGSSEGGGSLSQEDLQALKETITTQINKAMTAQQAQVAVGNVESAQADQAPVAQPVATGAVDEARVGAQPKRRIGKFLTSIPGRFIKKSDPNDIAEGAPADEPPASMAAMGEEAVMEEEEASAPSARSLSMGSMGNFIRGMARRGARAKQGPVHVADSGQAEMMDDNTAGPSLPAAEREEMGKSTGASRMFSRIPSFGKRSKSQSDMGTEATKTSTRKRTPFSFRRNRAIPRQY